MTNDASGVWGEPTRWSRILSDPHSQETWHFLLKRYRGPVLGWVRRRLQGQQQAEEIAVDFFTYLFTSDLVVRADRERGRFRAFLQGVLRNYLRSELRKAPSLPRLESASPDPAVEITPEIEAREEAQWARRVLHNACRELLSSHPRNGELLLRYYGLKPFARSSTAELCALFQLNAGALHKALHDARHALFDQLQREVRETVSDPEAFAGEWQLVTQRLLEVEGVLMRDM